VNLLSDVKFEEINDKGLVITAKDGQKQTLEADSIVPMTPLNPDDNLAKALKGKVAEVHICGSCNKPGLIRDAVNEGYSVGFAL
jgi:2,4-dienoyl-CoA reductase (NADPH2)